MAQHISNSRTQSGDQSRACPSEYVIWDTIVPKLGRRLRKASETWIVQWRVDARTRKHTLGPCSELSVETARTMARELLNGKQLLPLRSTPRLSTFANQFLAENAPNWKPLTRQANKSDLDRLILPHLGVARLDQVTPAAVRAWKDALAVSQASANRALATLSGLMRHAEVLGLIPPGSNPCKGLRRRSTEFSAQYLSPEGWARLGKALAAYSHSYPAEVHLIQFLALTGCRRSEALALQWSMIDQNRAALPDAKTGPRSVWLGRAVTRLLAGMPKDTAYVFANGQHPPSSARLDRIWRLVRARADLPKLRLHDLRHSFASVAINASVDLRVVGGLLGHSDLKTTLGYAHLEETTIKAASQRVGSHLDRLHKGKTRSGPRGIHHPNNLFVKFSRSRQTLPEFCVKEGVDIDAFRRELQLWRKRTMLKKGATS